MSAECTGWNIWSFRNGEWSVRADRMVEETPLRLVMAGQEAAVLMATPGHEVELAAGFAVTMGWVAPDAPPVPAKWDPGRAEVRLEVPGGRAFDPGIKAVGGGPLGPAEAQPLEARYTLELEQVLTFTERLMAGQKTFELTSATHAVALFDQEGGLKYLAEDAGRHNALDKAVGMAWLDGGLPEIRAAAFSGRMSLEMVLKAARAGLAVMVSVSAPSGPAVRSAMQLGVTLAGFARKSDLNIYCHPERIVNNAEPLGLTPRPGPLED